MSDVAPQTNTIHDAIIVGGGPAGASCAIWLKRLGFAPLLIETAGALGGLARVNPFQDDWTPLVQGETGHEIAGRIARGVVDAGVAMRLQSAVSAVERRGRTFEVTVRDAQGVTQILHAHTVVIASGVTARGLDGAGPTPVPGILVGPGSDVADRDYRGLRVAILGGGDNAFENYTFVRERDPAVVHLYARHVRAQQQWIDRTRPEDVRIGAYDVDINARRVNGLPYDLLLVFYGWVPQVPYAEGLGLVRDARGFVRTARETAETSVDGIYAIGEVAHRMHPCVVTSLADGVVAAKAIQARLEPRP